MIHEEFIQVIYIYICTIYIYIWADDFNGSRPPDGRAQNSILSPRLAGLGLGSFGGPVAGPWSDRVEHGMVPRGS